MGATGAIDGAGTLHMLGGTTTIPDGATVDPAVADLTGGNLAINGTAPATTLDTRDHAQQQRHAERHAQPQHRHASTCAAASSPGPTRRR